MQALAIARSSNDLNGHQQAGPKHPALEKCPGVIIQGHVPDPVSDDITYP